MASVHPQERDFPYGKGWMLGHPSGPSNTAARQAGCSSSSLYSLGAKWFAAMFFSEPHTAGLRQSNGGNYPPTLTLPVLFYGLGVCSRVSLGDPKGSAVPRMEFVTPAGDVNTLLVGIYMVAT